MTAGTAEAQFDRRTANTAKLRDAAGRLVQDTRRQAGKRRAGSDDEHEEPERRPRRRLHYAGNYPFRHTPEGACSDC